MIALLVPKKSSNTFKVYTNFKILWFPLTLMLTTPKKRHLKLSRVEITVIIKNTMKLQNYVYCLNQFAFSLLLQQPWTSKLIKETKSATINIFRKKIFSFLIFCKSRIKLCFNNKSVHYSWKLHEKWIILLKQVFFSLLAIICVPPTIINS